MEELTLGIYVPFIQFFTKQTDDSEYFKKTNGQQPIARPPTGPPSHARPTKATAGALGY